VGLIDVHGTLYGTTFLGGNGCTGSHGCGTVFRVSPDGTEKVLHSFSNNPDGAWPQAALIDVKGTLYGTTEGGGKGCGTVFKMGTNGRLTVLHAFGLRADGCTPEAGLVDVNGTLYGTTAYGGTGLNGVVYSITPSGKERVLHDFCKDPDGCNPVAGLTNLNGTLYGTTANGYFGCCGMVYSITTNGTEKVLYRFAGGSDGANPIGGLVDVDGVLYGTTTDDGGTGCPYGGCGIAYSVTTTGTEQVVYRFAGAGSSDGAYPRATMIDVNGTLYGTTVAGGRVTSRCKAGCGTIFSLTPSGVEKVLFAFKTAQRGEPWSSLIDVNGAFFGTTPMDHGTAFSFVP
jgi:uncharacterized repeat protein (TIGR03803 family)